MILQPLASSQEEEEASDTSSAPYIFLDNSSSTDEQDSVTKRSTPHMFLSLSYANNDRPSNDVGDVEKPLIPTRKNNQQPSPRSNLHRRSSSAHQFLPYASNHSGGSDPCCSSSSDHEVASEVVIRYFGWGKSGQQFEEKCQQHLVNEHSVPHFHASFVAKAVQGAAEETAEARNNREVCNSYCLYASMFDRLFTASNNIYTGKENSRCPTAPTEAESSLSSQVQSLKVESQRQQEELEFLRSTLRRLILPSAKTNRNEAESPKHHFVDGKGGGERANAVEDGRDHKDIPQEIICFGDENNDDDISEPTIKIKCEDELEEREEDAFEYNDNIMTDEKAAPQLVPPSHRTSNILKLVAGDTSREGIDNEPNPEQVDPNRKSSNDTDESNDHCSKDSKSVCYDEMAKGDVCGKRARGLRYGLCFTKSDNIRFMGMYSGQVRDQHQHQHQHQHQQEQQQQQQQQQQQKQVPHGRGVLRFDNRDLYIGEFCDGEMHGEGTLLCRSCDEEKRIVTLRGCFQHNEYIGRQQQRQLKQSEKGQQQTISSSWCEI